MAQRREVHIGDLKINKPSDLIIPGLGAPLVREPEQIEAIDRPLITAEIEMAQFMEDVLDIRLEPGREKNAPQLIDVYVNGVAEWIPVGKAYPLKRKYVEVLARAKPMTIATHHETPDDGVDPQNRISRTVHSQHPFSVIRDPNPKGFEWLTRVLAEG